MGFVSDWCRILVAGVVISSTLRFSTLNTATIRIYWIIGPGAEIGINGKEGNHFISLHLSLIRYLSLQTVSPRLVLLLSFHTCCFPQLAYKEKSKWNKRTSSFATAPYMHWHHTFFVALKWVALPLRLLEVPSSNTFLDTSSSNCCFSCFPSSSRSLHHKHFFLHPFNLIVYWWLPHPHYIFQATDSANK